MKEELVKKLNELADLAGVYESEVQSMIERERAVTQIDHHNAERNAKLDKMQIHLDKQQKDLNMQSLYITQRLKELAIKEENLEKKVKELNQNLKDFEDNKTKWYEKSAQIEKRIEALKGIEDEWKRLKEQQDIIVKEKAIDADRKKVLDMREKHIQDEQKRLDRFLSQVNK